MKGLGHAVFSTGDVIGNDFIELKCLEIATMLLKTGGSSDLLQQEQAKGVHVSTTLEGKLVNHYDNCYQSFWNSEVRLLQTRV
jgi:hypothetical protein